MIVYCLLCLVEDADEEVHIFSTPEKRQEWRDSLGDDDYPEYAGQIYKGFVFYDYEVDNPARYCEVQPRAN